MKEVSALNIKKLVFKNFKTLEEVSFEPGRVNVFIGANGSGKTTILEAIGLLCAAMTDRVDNASMQRKGIRLSVPGLYKSAFSDLRVYAARRRQRSVQWKFQFGKLGIGQ